MDKNLYHKTQRQLALLFAFGFLGGCIYFNVLWRMRGSLFQNQWRTVGDCFSDVSTGELHFWMQNNVWLAIVLCLVTGVIGFWKKGRILLQGIVLSVGAAIGATETMLLLSVLPEQGALLLGKAVLIFLPYLFSAGMAFVSACAFSRLRLIWLDKTKKWQRIQLKRYIITIFCTVAMPLVYILICSYVNR